MKIMLVIPAVVALTACSHENNDSHNVGMANPASVYCVKVGGKLEIVNEKHGQVGYCTLPDGERVEEWTLLRRDKK